MNRAVAIILLHQVLFQGMFLAKNIYLRHKLGVPVRGSNREANLSIVFFVVFIALAVILALLSDPPGALQLAPASVAVVVSLVLLVLNLVAGIAALLGLRDSWRVGVIEEQRTELVEDGIYRFSRNPYFLSYLLMFAAYSVLLQNLVLVLLSLAGFWLIHAMIRREERYLGKVHGQPYREYCQRVPRYLLW